MRLSGTPPSAILRRIVRVAPMLLVLGGVAVLAIGSTERPCPEIDPDYTTVLVEAQDECTTTIWVCPRDSHGTNIGPGYNLYISLDSTAITLALEDLGDGTYRAIVDECVEGEIASWELTVGCTDTLASESVETSGEMHDPQIFLAIDVDPEIVCQPVGDVTYTYTVTNTGDDPLHDVVVVDDNGTPGDEEQAADDIFPVLLSGDENGDGVLDVDEVWIFETTQTRAQDTHTTTTVSASGTVHPDERISASADAAVDFRHPAVGLQLIASKPIVRVDESVSYTYEVCNTGDDPLSDIQLTMYDVDGNPVERFDAELDGDHGILHAGVTSCVSTRLHYLSSTTVMTARLAGKDSCGNLLTAESTITVEVINPAIEAEASATPTFSACPTQVTYTCEIRNTGDAPLTDIVVQGYVRTGRPFILDLTSGDDGNRVLDVGETWICEALIDRDSDALTTLHVFGLDPAGRSVECEDQVATEILVSSWHIEAEAEPVIVYAGETVTYTYHACNDGETALHDLRVLVDGGSDAMSGDGPAAQHVSGDENGNSLLEPGECWVFSADLEVSEDLSAIAEASALDPCGNLRSATVNPVSVDVIHPALTLRVWAEAGDVYPTDRVVTTYRLTNAGDDPLRNVALIDSSGDGRQLNPSLTGGDDDRDHVLDVGESWTYVRSRVAEADTYGIVTATAQDSLRQSVTVSSEYVINVIMADLSVSRTMIPLAANRGDRVTFRYEVTNHGEVPVEDVVVTDDRGTPDDIADDVHPVYVSGDDGDWILDAGEVWFYELAAVLSDENLGAHATATGASRRESASVRTQPTTARIEKLGLGELQGLELGASCEELTFAIEEMLRTWNPLLVDPYSSFMTTIHRGLTRRNPVSGSAELDLAESIEVSGDEVIVHLHEGLRWSDGEPFTAEDVVFTYEVLLWGAADVPYRRLFSVPPMEPVDPDGDPWAASIVDWIELYDEHTVILQLWFTCDCPLILDQVWDALRTPILPKHVLEEDIEAYGLDGVWGLGTELRELVGMGPYVVAEYSEAGTDDPYVDRVVLERNPYFAVSDHAGTPLPYADRVEFRTIGTREMENFLTDTSYFYDSESLDAISITSTDLVYMGWTYADDMDYSFHTEPIPATTWLVFNQNERSWEHEYGQDDASAELCRTAAYRQAIAHLIDRDELEWRLVDLFLGADASALETFWSLLDSCSPYHYARSDYGGAVSEESEVPYPFDPSEAARLLDEAELYCEDWCESDRCCWWQTSRREDVDFGLGCRSDYSCSIAGLIEGVLQDYGLVAWIEEVFWGDPFDCDWQLDASLVTTCDSLHLYELNQYLSPYGDSRFWSPPDERDYYSLTGTEKQIWELLDSALWSADLDEVFEIYSEMQTLFAEECIMIPMVKAQVSYAIYEDVHNAEILFGHYPGSPMGLEYVYRAPE